MSVRSHNSKPELHQILCTLHVALILASDGVSIRCVLPVLRMTSCLRTVGPVGRIKHGATLRVRHIWWYQMDVRPIRCLVEFIRMRHRGRSLLCTIDLSVFVFVETVAIHDHNDDDFDCDSNTGTDYDICVGRAPGRVSGP